MPDAAPSYWAATRHPWSCILFVLPLLLAYECGLQWSAPGSVEAARNGADVWLRAGLAAVGVPRAYGAPALLLVTLLAWGLLRRDRPSDQAGVWAGMAVESAAFAVALFGLSHAMLALTQRLALSTPGPRGMPEPALELVVSYLGAGVYEETLFRLLAFSGLLTALRLAELPGAWCFVLAAGASALLFAGAHHLGPHGEPFTAPHFAFRTFAGLYFAGIYHGRGFGIAVGAHALYDVLVGLLLR